MAGWSKLQVVTLRGELKVIPDHYGVSGMETLEADAKEIVGAGNLPGSAPVLPESTVARYAF